MANDVELPPQDQQFPYERRKMNQVQKRRFQFEGAKTFLALTLGVSLLLFSLYIAGWYRNWPYYRQVQPKLERLGETISPRNWEVHVP